MYTAKRARTPNTVIDDGIYCEGINGIKKHTLCLLISAPKNRQVSRMENTASPEGGTTYSFGFEYGPCTYVSPATNRQLGSLG
jgi:hypothetical protein